MQVSANGLSIEVDDQGPVNGPPLLLVMGLGMQLTGWPDEFVAELVGRGFRVIRFDNRDAGLSTGFDHVGVPNLATAALKHLVRLPITAPYSLEAMALDAVGVLDALGIASAHVCGASMGGMIAQHLAARHPARVKSLALVMTTSGARGLPQASARVQAAMISRPGSAQPEAIVAHLVRLLGLIGSPAYPPEPSRLQARLRDSVARAWRPAGTARQLTAVVADGDRTPLLGRITAPTVVVHGEADPLVPVAGGRDLLAKINGATGEFIPGMGHDLPLELLPRIAQAVADNAQRKA